MSTFKILYLQVLTVISLSFPTQLWAETDCSRDAIGYYLEKGFTPEQVSRMCQATVPSASTSISTFQAEVTKPVQQTSSEAMMIDEQVFFNKTILADSLSITPQALSYVRDQCIRYGEEDIITGFRPKVCGSVKTTINRVGLIVLSAVKGFSIFKDPELLVKGQIHREVINFEELSSTDRKAFEKILDPSPETFNIETRADTNTQEVAARLPR